jgi:hypothetical protein
MAESSEKPVLLKIAEHFQKHRVEYLVIGGQAAALLGSSMPTYDTDLCYRRTAENLERLAAALKELHPTLRGVPPDLPFRLDAQSLALGSNFTFNTDLGPLDLLGWVEPFGLYEELAKRAETVDLEGTSVSVICLDDLIRIKQHIGRPKDKMALIHLEAIKKLKEQTEPE